MRIEHWHNDNDGKIKAFGEKNPCPCTALCITNSQWADMGLKLG